MTDWAGLLERLNRSTGADPSLDRDLADAAGIDVADFTESAEACHGLAARVLPGWRLHVGYDARGLFPYAAFRQGDAHVEATAPTLPLAILRALVTARGR